MEIGKCEAMVEYGGRILHIETYSENCYIPTDKICQYMIGQNDNGYYWTIKIDMVDRQTKSFGLYTEYSDAERNLEDLITKIYGPDKEQEVLKT